MRETFTLWSLLQKHEIIIPMIQRDYAQGRSGKEYIRSTFLESIRKSLCDGTDLTLDFVYGNVENGKFQPLDGQQRLTTLWLLHWYFSFRLGKLKDPAVTDTLQRFTYQTRTSSSDFCRKICHEMIHVDAAEIHCLAAYIKDQTWFFTEWMQDPTVNAMLRMLSGDPVRQDSAKNPNRNDCIEGVFGALDRDRLELCWTNLAQSGKISFELMIIGTEKLPISDDLYIKMNARGKKLTHFENFKADLISHMQQHPAFAQEADTITLAQHYAKLIDNAWTDVFWNAREKNESFDGNIDSAFFAFFNRYVLNHLCLDPAIPPTYFHSGKHVTTDEDILLLQKQFDTLYGTGSGRGSLSNDDTQIEYQGFEIYRDYLTPTDMGNLENIFEHLKQHGKELEALSISSIDEDETAQSSSSRLFRFLPRHDKENRLLPIALKERIYFHALCLFLEKPRWENLSVWMRLVRNLVENADIDNLENMIGCLRDINGLGLLLGDQDWEVYKNLAGYRLNSSVTRLADQWEEELEKAKKINEDSAMTQPIQAAEDHGFFNGTIRFLYTGADGQPDWAHFLTKLDHARGTLFPGGNTVAAETTGLFLKAFRSFQELPKNAYFFTTIGYDRRKKCWKRDILCRTDIFPQLHRFFMGDSAVATGKYEQFISSGAVEAIGQKDGHYNYLVCLSKDWSVRRHRSHTDSFCISDKRLQMNRILLDCQREGLLTVSDANPVYGDFLWSEVIFFQYGGNEYCWSLDWDAKNTVKRMDTKKSTGWDIPDKAVFLETLKSLA